MSDVDFRSIPIVNTFGLTSSGSWASALSLVDIDGDGDLDAFVGGENGVVDFFQNKGNMETPIFEKQMNNFGISNVVARARPVFVDIDIDIDNDGDMDAFVGNYYGQNQFYRNTGTSDEPLFVKETTNFGIKNLGYYASPTFADIDGDGDQDAFIGGRVGGGISFYRNSGTASEPILAKENTNFGLTVPINKATPAFIDIDGDGDQDVLVGNGYFGYVSLFLNNFNDAPTLSVPTILYFDTRFDDTLSVTEGVLLGNDVDSTVLTYDISGGVDNGDGTVSKMVTMGLLTVNKTTGNYTFVPNSSAMEALGTTFVSGVDVTVSDGLLTTTETISVRVEQGGFFESALTETEGDDVLTGTDQDDKFNGLGGNDSIFGLAGNDVLIGGTGDDLLDGGDGVDTASYITSPGGVRVDLSLSGPQDTGKAGIDSLLNIENVIGSNFNDVLISSSASNVLIGGLGDDILNGVIRFGADTASYITAKGGVTVDLNIVTRQNTVNAGFDTLIKIENLSGSNFDDILIGDSRSNILRGNFGNDLLNGGIGPDTASYTTAEGGVIVNLSIAGEQNTVSAGLDTLVSIEKIRGSRFDDILTGDDFDNDLNGLGGADVMSGGLGNDIYSIDNINDKIVETSSLGGRDRVISSISYTLHANFENLALTGTNAINGSGNALRNIIIGNEGNNVLNGWEGDDILTGGLGRDFFRFTTFSLDKILDFDVAEDSIQLENSVFTQLSTTGILSANNFTVGATAADEDDFIIYDKSTGSVTYDSNGSLLGGESQIALLTPGLTLTNADFIVI